jgi:hypothetical protein
VSREVGIFAGGHGTIDDGPRFVPSSSPIRKSTKQTHDNDDWVGCIGMTCERESKSTERRQRRRSHPKAGSSVTSRQNARNEPTTMRIGPIVGILLAPLRAATVIKSSERTHDDADWMRGRPWSAPDPKLSERTQERRIIVFPRATTLAPSRNRANEPTMRIGSVGGRSSESRLRVRHRLRWPEPLRPPPVILGRRGRGRSTGESGRATRNRASKDRRRNGKIPLGPPRDGRYNCRRSG